MFNWLSLFSGLVSLLKKFQEILERDKLISTGKSLQKGSEDAETIKAVENIKRAERDIDHVAIDNELRITKDKN